MCVHLYRCRYAQPLQTVTRNHCLKMAGDQQDPRRKILSRCYLVRYKPHMENSGSEATPLY